MKHVLLAVVAAAMVAVVSACESGPSGPGTRDAFVESAAAAFGAAVIDVQGPGIVGFEPVGANQVFWSATAQPDNYRVVVVSPAGGSSVPFRIRVRELADPPPSGTVIEAAGVDDNPVASLLHFSVQVGS